MALGAKMAPFAGWEMPISYRGVVSEHQAVRTGAGVFDVSHMGRIALHGQSSGLLLDRLSTNQILGKQNGQATYTLWCNEQGGSIDDLIAYQEEEDHFFVVANASNREKDYHHLLKHAEKVTITPSFEEEGILAVQGPEAFQKALPLFPALDQLKPMHFLKTTYQKIPLYLAATGYTGEKGFEIYAPNEIVPTLWDALVATGIEPIGLGARDTLRLEMGYALYGHELTEEQFPTESVAAWAVKMDKSQFLGKTALQESLKKGKTHFPAPLILRNGGIPRDGFNVKIGETGVGTITSGGFSPSLNCGIALALVDRKLNRGDKVEVEIRGKPFAAEVVTLPFWRKT